MIEVNEYLYNANILIGRERLMSFFYEIADIQLIMNYI